MFRASEDPVIEQQPRTVGQFFLEGPTEHAQLHAVDIEFDQAILGSLGKGTLICSRGNSVAFGIPDPSKTAPLCDFSVPAPIPPP